MIYAKVLGRLVNSIILSMFFASSLYGEPPQDTPPLLEKVTLVTAEEAWNLMQKGVSIFDVWVSHEYVEEHIKGAVSIPYKEKSKKRTNYDPNLDRFDLSKLPHKTTPIIFYCNAGKCWKSYKASKAAVEAGYTNVYWLRGGIPQWKKKNLPVE
ncbi:MAG TPA: rhodanese-like domain-containing protein [Nitrospiria bacterium]|jgi:rhodanese-related sulfurtransferase